MFDKIQMILMMKTRMSNRIVHGTIFENVEFMFLFFIFFLDMYCMPNSAGANLSRLSAFNDIALALGNAFIITVA